MTEIIPWRNDGREFREMVITIVASLVLHLVLFTIVIVMPRTPPKKRIIYTPVYHVDLVTLKPVKKKAPPPKPKPPPKPVAKPKPKPKPKTNAMPPPKPKKKPKPKPPEESYKMARSAIDDLKRKYKQKRVSDSGVGGLDEGISRELMNLRFKRYYNKVQEKVKAGWIAPPEISGKVLEVMVGIEVTRDGKILTIKIEKPSGNLYFDQSVIRATKKASPLPPLPKSFVGNTHELGFRFSNEE